MRTRFFLALILSGCAVDPEPIPLPEPAYGPGSQRPVVPPPPQEAVRLSIERALDLADRSHPDLALQRARVEAAAGRAHQAGLLPNPVLLARRESASLEGTTISQAEFLAGFSQRLPIGGRLGAATEAERREVERLAREQDVRRLEIHSRVRGAFATALFAAEVARVNAETHDLARRAVDVARLRRDAGDATADEVARSEMEEIRSRLEVDKAQGLRDLAFVGLAAALGDAGLRIEAVEGSLERALDVPSVESVLASLDGGVHAALARADLHAARARIDLAKAERIPDVTLDLFYRRLEVSDRNAFDIGIVVPLPLFDRNQGRIREAQAESRAAEARGRATRDEAVRRVREAHVKLSEAVGHVRLVRDELLPKAAVVSRTAETRYGAGDLSLAEILPIRREAAAVRLAYLEGLREIMEAWGELRLFLKP
ncbi:MAG: TolC family protein [Planctomycetota bacterium]|nr:MAG: TolC family protein [Planctomycetota bacterium]